MNTWRKGIRYALLLVGLLYVLLANGMSESPEPLSAPLGNISVSPISLKLLLRTDKMTLSQSLYEVDKMDGRVDENHIVHKEDYIAQDGSNEKDSLWFYQKGGKLLKRTHFDLNKDHLWSTHFPMPFPRDFRLVQSLFGNNPLQGRYEYFDRWGRKRWDVKVPVRIEDSPDYVSFSSHFGYLYAEVVEETGKATLYNQDRKELFSYLPVPEKGQRISHTFVIFSPDDSRALFVTNMKQEYNKKEWVHLICLDTKGKEVFRRDLHSELGASANIKDVAISEKYISINNSRKGPELLLLTWSGKVLPPENITAGSAFFSQDRLFLDEKELWIVDPLNIHNRYRLSKGIEDIRKRRFTDALIPFDSTSAFVVIASFEKWAKRLPGEKDQELYFLREDQSPQVVAELPNFYPEITMLLRNRYGYKNLLVFYGWPRSDSAGGVAIYEVQEK